MRFCKFAGIKKSITGQLARQAAFLLLVILASLGTTFAQQDKGSVSGTVTDDHQNPLAGATITVEGAAASTTTDQNGSFQLSKLPVGKQVLKVSYVGFTAMEWPVEVTAAGNRTKIVMAGSATVALTDVIVTTQKRSERLLEVPIAITGVDAKTIQQLGLKDLDILSNLTPGLNIQMQSTQRPSYAIRGITSEDNGAGSQPRVSVYHNGVPISRASGSALELYDMEGVEAVKGPQGTLFGRGAQSGAIHFKSAKPKSFFETAINLGYGNYNQALAEVAVNTPIVKDKLLARFAGTIDYRDGYIKNTFGGRLNGRNTMAGKAYITYMPTTKTRINIMYDYQKDDAPGTAFMTKLKNKNGDSSIYSGTASFEQGKNLATKKNIHEITGTVDHRFNDALSLSTITSYRYYNAFEWWDGDGSAAPALNFQQLDTVKVFYQELRLNLSKGRFKGFAGAAYWNENATSDLWFNPNEQSAAFLILAQPRNLVNASGTPNFITNLPASMGGAALPTNHEEMQYTRAKNSSLDYFADGTYAITDKLSVTAGIRFTQDFLNSGYRAENTKGDPSAIGRLLGNYPNFFFKAAPQKDSTANFNAFTGRAVVKYSFTKKTNAYVSVARGRRPQVLQFTSGVAGVLSDEIVTSYELGIKTQPLPYLSFELAAYSYNYEHFQTSAAKPTAPGTPAQWVSVDGGMASAYGGEFTAKYAINKNITFTGNYAYIHARFEDNDKNGVKQRYAGNRFRLSPDHSFNLMLNLQLPTSNGKLVFFATPSYAYKSEVVFDDANTPGLQQEPYGIANIIGGLRLPKQNLSFSLYANNLFNKEYFLDAGNTGLSFGLPSFVPAAPLNYGIKIAYSFRK